MFKYTSNKPSPLPPMKPVQAGFKSPMTAQFPPAFVQNNKNEGTSLRQATRTFSSNLLLFQACSVQDKGPKLADRYGKGGSGDGSVLTREATMQLYEKHSGAYDEIVY
ncbi:hypothetical protein HDU79_002828 [Rhizoclosmatium sp. JEL0117]|nr:hypothetical protein HDU79_002828 [Rhizoclosmatium sp. JEL0117]